MKRIDAHLHYWSLARGDYAWLTPSAGALYRDFAPSDIGTELAGCSVVATVLVQAAATEAETRFLLGLAARHPSIAAVVGWVDFEAPDAAARIRRLMTEGGGKLRGLRPMVQDLSDPQWLERPGIDRAFEALIEHDLTFDALVTPPHLEVLLGRLQKHPRLRAVLDHCGKPGIAAREFDPWARGIEALALSTSLCCKLSGLLTEAATGAGAAELDPFVEHVFRCFGPERILWGSDWPVLTLRASYRQWLELSTALVRRHAAGHESAVFADNAARFYGLEFGP